MNTFFTLLFSVGFFAGMAQIKIHGRISDNKGDAIPGANVFLLDTYDGGSSSIDGSFEFTTSEIGKKTLVVKFLGYKDSRQEVILDAKNVFINVVLEETINELEAVTITAGAFTASDASRRTVFKAIDIATTAGATADIAGALNTLPGTQKVGETGRLFVRGGDSNEAKTFIDGMIVLDAYGTSAPNTPSRGRFLPFMFKGTSFSTGGYSSEYGQALSSALVLDSKDKAESTRTDIGILSVGGDVAHTQSWAKGSAAAKIQYTNIRPYFGLINQEIDWKTPPAAIEGVGVFRQQVGKAGLFKFYGNFNHSEFSLYNHAIHDYAIQSLYRLKNDYRYLNTFYKNPISEKWSVRGGLSYTSIQNDAWVDTDNIVETEKGIHAKTVLEGTLSEKIELKTGAEIIHRRYTQDFRLDVGSDYALRFNELIAATFIEADLYTSNKFVTRAGARLEYNSLIHKAGIDPRISLAYKAGKSGQVSFAYGKFRQTAANTLVRVNQDLHAEKAEHFILNYQVVEDNRTFRIETYYKRYDNLVKYVDGNPLALNNAGDGFAKGVELFWRDNRSIKNADYWVSYSFLNTERDYLNFPNRTIPTFASAHNFSFVYKHFIPDIKCQTGLTYSYTSGRPYNNPNAETFQAGKTPHYADLSVNLAYLPKPNLILYFSCTNLLGRDNIFGYEYSTIPDDSGVYARRAIRQAAPRFLFVGIFITISKEKSINQLPSL
jgi:CarboxypepD_reg-like domain/TonB-dependent Receptor Plug Domain